MASPSSRTESQQLLWGLVAALSIWGIYLAIGATGWFANAGLFDRRRSWFVLGCSTAFVGCWLWLLRGRRRSEPGASVPRAGSRNVTSLVSLIVALIAWLTSSAAWFAYGSDAWRHWVAVLAWAAVALFGLATLLAVIGLSDPRRERNKLCGLLTLLLVAIAIVHFIVQMRPTQPTI